MQKRHGVGACGAGLQANGRSLLDSAANARAGDWATETRQFRFYGRCPYRSGHIDAIIITATSG